MVEEEYIELRDAMDVIAERIRALGVVAPGSYTELVRLASVPDEEGAPGSQEMIRRLCDAHELVVRSARPLLASAEEARDAATADLVTERIAAHEKTAWMLRSTLGPASRRASENPNG